MEWYHGLNIEYIEHKGEHDLGVEELSECLACEICYPVTINPVVFQKFWNFLFKFEYTIEEYNGKTIGGVLELLSMSNKEREETCHKGRCRNIIDRIIESKRGRGFRRV
jgi:hypothetical protein